MNRETGSAPAPQVGNLSEHGEHGERSNPEQELSGAPRHATQASSTLLRYTLLSLTLLAALPWLTNQIGAFTHGQGVYDFSVYYAAALALRDNAHANIYDPAVLQKAAALHSAYLMPGTALYLYPPLLAIAFVPLTVLPFTIAAYVWAACNIAFWVIATGLIISIFADMLGCKDEVRAFARGLTSFPRAKGSARLRFRALSDTALFAITLPAILAMMSATFEESVVIGQVSLLVLLLLTLALWLDRRGKPAAAGAVLAVAALIKVFPGLFLLYYILRGRWRAVAGFVLGMATIILMMALYVGVPGVLATRNIFSNGSQSGLQFQNESLSRVPFWLSVVVHHPIHERWAKLLGYGLIAVVLMAFVFGLVWAAWGRWRSQGALISRAFGETASAGFAWALCTMVLISPVTWEHHLAWLLPAFVVGVGLCLARLPRSTQEGSAWKGVSPVVLLAVLAIGYVMVAHDLPFGYDGRVPFDPSPNLVGKIPVRPFFMIQRPLGGFLLWCASGYLFLRMCSHPGLDKETLVGEETRAGQETRNTAPVGIEASI